MSITFDAQREDLRWALLLAAMETVADASLKAASQQVPESTLSPIGGGLYVAQAYVLQKAVMKNNLGIVNAYWNAATSIINVGVGMSFGEKYSNQQLIGIALISAGVLLI
jgi:multidrug transporter EmrE-like cation transporter